jgi:hypothetical protein
MKKTIVLAAASLAVMLAPLSAQAATFAQNHPRRAQVLHRANHQEGKENNAYASGKITGRQDARLHREDQSIKHQEQRDAAINGGFITKGQQNQLNREENRVNHQLHRDEKVDASAP